MTGITRRIWAWMVRHPEWAVALASIPVIVNHLIVIHHQRVLGTFDIDEAGYLANAFRARRALEYGGLPELWRSLPGDTAPLVPTLSGVLVLARPRSIVLAMAVQPVFAALSAVGVAGVVRRTAGPRAALVGGVVVLGLPAAMVAATTYKFAGAAACFMVLAVWALLCSDGLQRWWPTLGFGASVGLLCLSRTMAVSFLPALAVGVVLLAPRNRVALRNGAAAVGVAAAIAAPWWVTHLGDALGYLRRSGYGAVANQFAHDSIANRVRLRVSIVTIAVRPLLLVALLVAVVGAVVAHQGPRLAWRRLRSPEHRELGVLWVIVAVGYVALLSSANLGTWFDLPLLVLVVAGTVAIAAHVRAPWSRWAGALAVAGALANVVLVGRVGLGDRVVFQSRSSPSSLSAYLFAGSASEDVALIEVDRRFLWGSGERDQAVHDWAQANARLAQELDALDRSAGGTTRTLTGSTALLSGNSLKLTEELTTTRFAPLEEFDRFASTEDFLASLRRPAGGLRRVVVIIDARSPGPGGRAPVLRAIAGVRAGGWVEHERLDLPDGGRVLIFVRP